jgi:tetratricopeptide (TPR) repeat protein
MNEKTIQIISVLLIGISGGLIFWVYTKQPQNLQEMVSKAAVSTGTYGVNETEFKRGLELFRQDNFTVAREAFDKADPEKHDAKVQFYAAYSFYRQGFGKVYDDDTLFKQGLEAINRAIALGPDLKADDENLKMKTPQEVKAELQKGLEVTVEDFNPLKLTRERK